MIVTWGTYLAVTLCSPYMVLISVMRSRPHPSQNSYKLEINIERKDDSFTPVTQYLTTHPYAIFTKHLHFPNKPKDGGYLHSPNI